MKQLHSYHLEKSVQVIRNSLSEEFCMPYTHIYIRWRYIISKHTRIMIILTTICDDFIKWWQQNLVESQSQQILNCRIIYTSSASSTHFSFTFCDDVWLIWSLDATTWKIWGFCSSQCTYNKKIKRFITELRNKTCTGQVIYRINMLLLLCWTRDIPICVNCGSMYED